MPSVSANLSFYSPPADGSKAWYKVDTDPVTGAREQNWVSATLPVKVEDLRGKEDEASLDTTGYQFFRHPASHKAFTDDEAIQHEYYPESAEYIKSVTGASRVLIFDHTVRRRYSQTVADLPDKRQPFPMVHVDQTPESAENRVRRHAPADADALLKKRFQIINLWRPINNAALDWPLALCDYRTTDPARDFEPMTMYFADRTGETFGVKHSPEQRWVYVSGLTPEEGILIKCYDSSQDASVASTTAHTAFEDPSTPADAPKRVSIEIRALVFYD